jgi:hypothetical protein
MIYPLLSTLDTYLNAEAMKKTFTLLFFYSLLFSAKAQTAPADSSAGDILSLTENQYDFGKIPQGKPVSHVFDVVNNGKDTLGILNIMASCGCTTPQWERGKKVAPGERTEIIVGYNAASVGSFTKSITITYNKNKIKIIAIKGEVWKTPATSAPENNEAQNLKNL